MQHERLREEVQRRVSEQLIPRLFDRMIERHSKSKAYTECDCKFCRLKRAATYYIGTASYPPNYTGYRPTGAMLEAGESLTDLKRNFLRVWFRQQMKECINE